MSFSSVIKIYIHRFPFVLLTQLPCIVIVSGLKIFTLNDYSVQFVFYFIYINLQIALAFFLSIFFSEVKTAAGLNFEHTNALTNSSKL